MPWIISHYENHQQKNVPLEKKICRTYFLPFISPKNIVMCHRNDILITKLEDIRSFISICYINMSRKQNP